MPRGLQIPLTAIDIDFANISYSFEDQFKKPPSIQIKEFEELPTSYFGSYCLAVNSGTAGLHLALLAMGVKQGDYVICSAFTFAASANPVRYLGATPVFVDAELESWNMDPYLLQLALEKMKSEKKTVKAIIVAHIYGMPAKIQQITDIASSYGLPVIEDAAQAFGSTYNGKPIGTFGTMGVFSFNNNKVFSLLGGGLLISNNPELIEKSRYYATQANEGNLHYQHKDVGYNYIMSPLNASLGYCLWHTIETKILARRRIFQKYYEILRNFKEISFQNEGPASFSNRWLTAILIDGLMSPDSMLLLLREIGVDSRRLWKPLFEQPSFEGSPSVKNETSLYLFKRGLCLPSNAQMDNDQIEKICELVLAYSKVKQLSS